MEGEGRIRRGREEGQGEGGEGGGEKRGSGRKVREGEEGKGGGKRRGRWREKGKGREEGDVGEQMGREEAGQRGLRRASGERVWGSKDLTSTLRMEVRLSPYLHRQPTPASTRTCAACVTL